MEVVNSVAGKVVDSLFGFAIREIGYMWNSSENVKTFKEEVDKLKALKETLQQRINGARHEGKAPGKDLENWMENADLRISEATKLIPEEDEFKKTSCNLRLCVNLGTLYRYGKMATKETSSLRKHQKEGEGFKSYVFDPLPAPTFTDLYQTKDLENMNTQKRTLKEIIEAIEDDKIQIVGITGLGGVGKTTLASEVAAKMKNQFADIVFITVSQTINYEKIKEKVEVAARRIIDGEKFLIILDDVWNEIKLDKIGIPCGSDNMNCKILITSRKKDVCEAMNAQKNISVNILKEEEAWTLFERVVNKNVWDETLKEVALKIVQECGGLPLFVQAVGKALKDKEMKRWEIALRRLKEPTGEDTPFKTEGIMHLKLSYDYLESEVAKSCFLLCSMFPEDGIIDIKRLTYYGVALGIFNNLQSIEDAKDRVQLAVDSLVSSFLLEKTDYKVPHYESIIKELLKMHDLVRDMALFVTSRNEDKFLVESGKGLIEWEPRNDIIKSYKKISLMGNKICKLPDHELDLPHLDTFLIQGNNLSVIPDEFFRGMGKLKVLDVSRNNISSLPQSLKQLKELRTLYLNSNSSLSEISILGELACLEILKLKRTGIKKIPEEIGRLTNLRVLDVYKCKDLSYVAPGVISKLIRLEELYLELKDDGNCEFLVELSELKSLKVLHLKVPELHYIPEDFHYETLTEFRINEDHFMDKSQIHRCKHVLQLSCTSFPFTKPIMKLIQASEMLNLCGIKDLDNFLPALYRENVDKLKYMNLRLCENLRSLVKTSELDAINTKGKFFSQLEYMELRRLYNLELLWDRPHQHISFFCNLVTMYIRYCGSLIKLFPLSVARSLVNLRKLQILQCASLVAIVSAEDEQTGGSDTDIVFPLTYIRLYVLPKLESFYSGHSTIKYPSLEAIDVSHCPSMTRWSYGESQIPNIKFEHEGRPCRDVNDYITVDTRCTNPDIVWS